MYFFFSDDRYHVAGDGKLAGIFEPNPARCYTNNSEYLLYDYPSTSQINYVVKQNKINIIFAIVKKPNSTMDIIYSKLSKSIVNSNFGLLDDKDDNNVISLLVDNYKVGLQSVFEFCTM